jgi:hypothetical protein
LTDTEATPDAPAAEPTPDLPLDGEHRSLQILPPPFGPERARPRAVVYVHLSAGQTRLGNLGPHVRRNHMYKTHGGWQVRQPEPGTWLWRSPHGRIYLVNASGTHPLGNTEFAQAIWRAAASNPSESAAEERRSGRDEVSATHPLEGASSGRVRLRKNVARSGLGPFHVQERS